MRISKICGKVLLFLVGVLLTNSVLTYLLTPANDHHDRMWRTYEACGEVDTIYIGSSVCMAAFDTYKIDAITGGKSINMGVPQQDVEQTYATVQMVLNQKPSVKRVVFSMDYPSLQFDTDHGSAMKYGYQLVRHEMTVGRKLAAYAALMSSLDGWDGKDSINFFFPWINNHVDIYGVIVRQNVARKRSGDIAVARTEFEEDFAEFVGLDESVNSRSLYGVVEIPEDNMQALRNMAKLCQEKGVELLVVNNPRPQYDILTYGESYDSIGEQVRHEVEGYGAKYYDFNYVRPERFDVTYKYYFADCEHLTSEGAFAFSKAMAQFLLDMENGMDMSEEFISRREYEERS